MFHETEVEEIKLCINNFKNRSASGIDGITPKFISMLKLS